MENVIDTTFETLHALRNLGPEYFDLKIRLVHQDLQEAKAKTLNLAVVATPGYSRKAPR